MNTPTPIEVVREMELWRSGQGKYAPDGFLPPIKFVPPRKPAEHAAALAAVLELAEIGRLAVEEYRLRLAMPDNRPAEQFRQWSDARSAATDAVIEYAAKEPKQ